MEREGGRDGNGKERENRRESAGKRKRENGGEIDTKGERGVGRVKRGKIKRDKMKEPREVKAGIMVEEQMIKK